MPTSHLRRVSAVAVTMLAVAAGVGFATATPALAATSKVTVIHGIPGQPVDVYVNGAKALANFQPGTVTGALDLAAGSYDVALTKPGEPIGDAIIKLDDAEVPGGVNLSVIAHLDAAGAPKLTAFVNDVSKLDPGKARLIVRHAAAAPAVDVRAGGTPVFTALTNGKEAKATLAAGTVSADVVLAGTATGVLGPTDLNLAEGAATIVYAIGSAEAKSLTLVSQTIIGLHSAPDHVPGGSGGQAATGLDGWWYGLIGISVLLIAAGGLRLVAVRRTTAL